MCDINNNSRILLIMRGLPGSGKSTYANKVVETCLRSGFSAIICSTDNYFIHADGTYIFDKSKLGNYHKQNIETASYFMRSGYHVVVIDNTNTTWKEIEPYVKIGKSSGYQCIIKESGTEWASIPEECFNRNSHNVPMESIKAMADRWEPTDKILEKI